MTAPLITAQCDAILHRGPDDQGVMTDGDFGFGMRRLSIIDIEGGHQPFHSPDGRYALVFNGEIYNYRELRRELQALGRVFDSAGDTEVILAGYERWGDDVWAKLDGMFAVAVWDTHARRLILARDPIGIKPLYYTDQSAGFAFGSELKTLTLLPGMAFDVDRRALHDYFSFGHVRTPRSIYAQVRTLPPGHVMTVEASGTPSMRAYWTPAYHPAEPLSEAQWIERFRDEWLDTIGKQMVADVDVGAFLSGGVDSSAVVAAMAQVSDRPVRTFTIGFPDPRFDESPHAEAIARHLGCHHVTRTLELADAQAMLPEVQHCYDEPFADPSAVPTWYVSQIAAQEVKVALSGDGGDELFFGYKRHATERRIGALPAPLRRLARALDAVPTLPSRHANAVLQRWRKTTGSAALPNGIARFFAKTQITNEAFRREIFSAEFIAEEEGGDRRARRGIFPRSRRDLDRYAGAVRARRPCAQPARRDADQGRPREHGAFARGARADAGAGDGRSGAVDARRHEAARQDRQVRDPAGDRTVAAGGDPRPAKTGLSDAARCLVRGRFRGVCGAALARQRRARARHLARGGGRQGVCGSPGGEAGL